MPPKRESEEANDAPDAKVAKKRESEEANDAPDAKAAKGESSNGKPTSACTWSTGGSGGFGALSAAGGFGDVASSGCAWSTGGGGGFASFGSGGGGGGFGALAASGGTFGSAATPAAADEAPAAAVPEMTTFGGATKSPSPFGHRKAPTDPPGSTESVGSETKDDEASVVVKGVYAGEENELCIHKVRGKLFRLEMRVKKLVKESVQADDEEDEGEDAEAAAPAAATPASAAASADPAPAAAAKEATDEAEAPPKPAASASSGSEGVETAAAGADGDMETRWVERGVGQVKLLKPKEGAGGEGADGAEVKARLVMRVEPHYSRLILNAPLLPTTAAIERPSDTSLRLVLHSAESASETSSKPSSFILRVKTSAEAQALLAAINKCIPASD